MHPVSLGLHSDACTWHWLWSWWKVHGSETSALTLFHQLRVSSKAWPWGGESSGFREMNNRGSHRYFSAAAHHFKRNSCWNFACCSLQFKLYVGKYVYGEKNCEEDVAMTVFSVYSGKWHVHFHEGPGHGISRLAKEVMGHTGSSQFNNHCLRARERTWTTPIQESKKMVPLGSLEIFSSL